MHLLLHALFLIFAASVLLYFIYIVIHLISWSRLPLGVLGNNYNPETTLSIIIAVRNEEATIANCLESISAQTYPANLLEIIVVDDHSTDRTKDVAEKALSKINIPGKCISNRESGYGKKSALAEGIKNSTGELIVVTDADCKSEKTWLSVIESEYQRSGAYMLCGPVQMTGENKFIEYFQSLELCGLSLLSGAGINAGIPLLCNGANIAYTRQVFDDVEGFKGIDRNPSGDDILLMFKVHIIFPGKIHYVKSKDTFVSTSAQASLKDFLHQRVRWASKGLYSKNPLNSFVSMLVFGSNFLSVVAIIFILVHAKLYPALMCCLAVKIISDFLLLLFGSSFFGKKKLLWIFPFAELVTMLYVSWVGIAANFSSYGWKGRRYKHPV